MKKLASHPTKKVISAVIACTAALSILAAALVNPLAAETYVCVVHGGEGSDGIAPGPIEVSPSANAFTTDSDKVAVIAANNPHGKAGGVITSSFHTYSEMGATMEEAYAVYPSRHGFLAGFGVDAQPLIGDATMQWLLRHTPNQIRQMLAGTQTRSTSRNADIVLNDEDKGILEQLLNIPLEIILEPVSSSKPAMQSLLDIAKDSVSTTGILTSDVGNAALQAAVSAVSDIPLSEVGDTPIEEIIVKTADKNYPSPDGKKYGDLLDVLIGVLDTKEHIKFTRDTPVNEFLSKVLLSDGEYRNRENDDTYPSFFGVSGAPDSNAKLIMKFEWPSAEYMKDALVLEFDGALVDPSLITISVESSTGKTVVEVSGLFGRAGYHSLHMSMYGFPFYFHIDLRDPEAPTTQAPTTQAPTTQVPTTQAPTTQASTTSNILAPSIITGLETTAAASQSTAATTAAATQSSAATTAASTTSSSQTITLPTSRTTTVAATSPAGDDGAGNGSQIGSEYDIPQTGVRRTSSVVALIACTAGAAIVVNYKRKERK